MAKKKNQRINVSKHEYEGLQQLARDNMIAMSEGPRRKTWSKHDIEQIQPKTDRQRDMFNAYYSEQNVIAAGMPGTGKTFLALFLSISDVVDRGHPQDKIKIIRSAVASRDIGHLPGTEEEKMSVFEAPYRDIMTELCGSPKTYEFMKESGYIEFQSTSHVRGSSWDDTIVIIDEAQNLTWHELNSVITRLGVRSRLIVCGDTKQCDLNQRREQTGFDQLIDVANSMNAFTTIRFKPEDCVRSGFVRDWLLACERKGLV